VIGRVHHPRESRLLDCYVAERSGEPIDPRVAEHLADCHECGTRYAELVRFLDSVRGEAEADADQVFTSERLSAQLDHVARRLEHVGRPPRIISFPGRVVARHMSPSGARGLTRWIYAAGVAGLVVGMGLGVTYQAEWHVLDRARTAKVARRQPTPPRRGTLVPVATAGTSPALEGSDDAFLSDLDVALERPRTRELQPFDAFTPHVREIRESFR